MYYIYIGMSLILFFTSCEGTKSQENSDTNDQSLKDTKNEFDNSLDLTK